MSRACHSGVGVTVLPIGNVEMEKKCWKSGLRFVPRSLSSRPTIDGLAAVLPCSDRYRLGALDRSVT